MEAWGERARSGFSSILPHAHTPVPKDYIPGISITAFCIMREGPRQNMR